jgi:hypothetical protein
VTLRFLINLLSSLTNSKNTNIVGTPLPTTTTRNASPVTVPPLHPSMDQQQQQPQHGENQLTLVLS